MSDTTQSDLTDAELYALPYDELLARNACLICLGPLNAGPLGNAMGIGISWTDTNGVAGHRCGATYRVTGGRLELTAYQSLIPLLRDFWRETHAPINPGAFCFVGSRRSNATEESISAWEEWMKEHDAEIRAASAMEELQSD